MASVRLHVGGRNYDLACRDGEEPRLEMLGALLDGKAREAGRIVGVGSEVRQLLLAGLLLADELSEARAGVPNTGHGELARTIDALAQQIETIAERLEQSARTS